MDPTVELRIHGVGEATAESLLGEETEADTVRVGGTGISFFAARRRDQSVEGYLWGRLTSRSLAQPLWLALLPFTMVNVAGWMHRPDDEARWAGPVARKAFHWMILVLAVGLTAAYAFWASDIVLNWGGGIPFLHGRPHLFSHDQPARVWLGAGMLAIALAVIGVVARWVQSGFEGFAGPWVSGAADRQHGEAVDPDNPTEPSLVRARLRPESERLSDPGFWNQHTRARGLLWIHLGIAAAAIVVAFQQAVRLAGTDPPTDLHLGRFPVWTTAAMLVVLVALGIWHLTAWKPDRGSSNRFHWWGPATTAGTGVAMATGVFYGLSLATDRVNADRVRALGTAFGLSAASWVAMVLAAAIWFLRRRGYEKARSRDAGEPESYLPDNGAELSSEPDGVGEGLGSWRPGSRDRFRGPVSRGAVATARAFAYGIGELDRVLSITALVFVASSGLMLVRGAPTGCGRLDIAARGIAIFGNWAAAGIAGFVLVFLVRRSFSLGNRRLVGVIWEVLTFWPRRFHPLAVRPYAERSVPEIQYRLRLHAEAGRGVAFSAHSQGSILAYAALCQAPRSVTERVALITYGSPLRRLYGKSFPAYFRETDFIDLGERLFDDDVAGRPTGWRNLFHLTDYIGQRVFDDSGMTKHEEHVPDPAQEPTAAQLIGGGLAAWPDTPRVPWVDLGRHSMYREELAIRRWTAEVRARLKGMPYAGVPGPGEGTSDRPPPEPPPL